MADSEISVSAVPSRRLRIELDQMAAIRHVAHAVLHEFDRLIVLKAEEAGRPHQIALAQTMPRHVLVVALEAEHRPFHDELVRTVGHDLANAERIHFALHDQIGPDRRHRHRPRAVEFLDEIHEAHLAQRQTFLEGAHFLLGVARDRLGVRFGRGHDAVPSALVSEHHRAIADDHEPERHQKRVQAAWRDTGP